MIVHQWNRGFRMWAVSTARTGADGTGWQWTHFYLGRLYIGVPWPKWSLPWWAKGEMPLEQR